MKLQNAGNTCCDVTAWTKHWRHTGNAVIEKCPRTSSGAYSQNMSRGHVQRTHPRTNPECEGTFTAENLFIRHGAQHPRQCTGWGIRSVINNFGGGRRLLITVTV